MLDREGRPLIAMAGKKEICMIPAMINRHGLITGATGTGKTVSLQSMAESFSSLGIPVFMADVKGDLSGMAKAGAPGTKLDRRAGELGLRELGYGFRAFPVRFWDLLGKEGHPLRATVSDLGPLLLSRLLGLNDVQSGVLQMVFRIADDQGLLLLDLKDLRATIQHVGEERAKYRTEYGQVSTASAGAIQRALLRLEDEGGDKFFGEPALDIMDLLQTENGLGVINILAARDLSNSPGLYSCALLWLLSELYESLPEIGDQTRPKLAFFFDEAHLLFDDISPALLQKIEQVARLIRSRGVGVYFISQNPSDIPDNVLGQLGNRLQHALRAFTPKDQKAVRAAAMAFRPNPAFSTAEVIGQLGVGEALVSLLDEAGAPAMVERCLVVPPEGQVGPISESERSEINKKSPLAGKYDNAVDRESAYELLARKAARAGAGGALGEIFRSSDMKNLLKERPEDSPEGKKPKKSPGRAPREPKAGKEESGILGAAIKSASRAVVADLASQATKGIGNRALRAGARSILRGILGGFMGGSR